MFRIRSLLGTVLVLFCLTATAASSSPGWIWRNPLPNSDTLTTIAFGAGVYVAAGQDGSIFSSPDGVNWTQRSNVLGDGGFYVDAIYGGGRFLLAGFDAAGNPHASTSTDGVTWTDTALPLDKKFEPANFLELGAGIGRFIVMTTNEDAISTDGVHWTKHLSHFSPVTGELQSLLYANGLFITYDSYSQNVFATPQQDVFYSKDGVSWTASSAFSDSTPVGDFASDGNSFFMFLGDKVSISTDGDHWSKQTMTGFPPIAEPVIWDGARFLLIGADPGDPGFSAYTSADGITWTKSSTPAVGDVPDTAGTTGHVLAAGSGGYVGVRSGFLSFDTSPDFVDWTQTSLTSGPSIDFSHMIYGGGHFVAVGQTTATQHPAIMESPDGVTWKDAFTGTGENQLLTVGYGDGTYVAAGDGSWFSSSDAEGWNSIPGSPSGVDSDIAFGNGQFVVFTRCPSCDVSTSADGKTWTRHALPTGLAPQDAIRGTFMALAFDSTRFVGIGGSVTTDAAGDEAAPVYTSCDGADWTHSGNIQLKVIGYSTQSLQFSRMRRLGDTLVATGSAEVCNGIDQGGCVDDSEPLIIVSSKDAFTWSIAIPEATAGEPETQSGDVGFDGQTYFASGDGTVLTSPDALTWTQLTDVPLTASVSSFANDGGQLIVAGTEGDILSSGQPSSVQPPSGSTCTSLPAVPDLVSYNPNAVNTGGTTSGKSSGGGELDIFTLLSLLGLLMVRRRPGI